MTDALIMFCARCGKACSPMPGVGGSIGRCVHGKRTLLVPLVRTTAEADMLAHLRRKRRRRKGPDPEQPTLSIP